VTPAETALLASATLQTRRWGYLLRDVKGIREIKDRLNLQRRPEPQRKPEKRNR